MPNMPCRCFCVSALLLVVSVLPGHGQNEENRRAAGGRGPELRSRVTQALDARELAVRQDPTNGQKWWDLGVEAQVAAGGSVQEEVGAARMLERAMMLQPSLADSFDNVMKVGDTLRGVRNSSRARHYYTLASTLQPVVSVPYVYAGLTLEMEGDFAGAARSYHLACRIQALGAAKVCEHMSKNNGLHMFAAGCESSYRGSSTYLAYVASAQLRSGQTMHALSTLSILLGSPSRRALQAVAQSYVIADAVSGRVLSFLEEDADGRRAHGKGRPLGASIGEVSGGWDAVVLSSGRIDPAKAAAAEMQEELRRLQFPPGGCTGQHRVLYYEFSQAFGFGAHAHMLSLALNIAHMTQRTLIPVPSTSWWLVDEKTCGRSGFSCFFEDFTSCTASAEQAKAAPPLVSLGGAAFDHEGGAPAILFEWESQTLAIRTGILRHYVPQLARPYGAPWWRGQATMFLMRPLPWLEEELANSMSRMGWREPAVGLHVRHGDKLKEANRIAIEDYLRVVVPLAKSIGAKTVFVSTDSPDVLLELERNSPSGLTFIAERDEIRGTDITNANLMNNLRLNVTRYTLEAVRGVLLLSRTQALVATFSSNFGRLAYEIMLARAAEQEHRPEAAHHPAAVSLDLPWFAFP